MLQFAVWAIRTETAKLCCLVGVQLVQVHGKITVTYHTRDCTASITVEGAHDELLCDSGKSARQQRISLVDVVAFLGHVWRMRISSSICSSGSSSSLEAVNMTATVTIAKCYWQWALQHTANNQRHDLHTPNRKQFDKPKVHLQTPRPLKTAAVHCDFAHELCILCLLECAVPYRPLGCTRIAL